MGFRKGSRIESWSLTRVVARRASTVFAISYSGFPDAPLISTKH